MNPLAPSSGPFDLHWRLFGIDFRVKPMFWLSQLLFGYFYVSMLRQVDQRLFAYLGIWLACAFVSVLIHELGHVTIGRVFGARSNIVLGAMGGMAVGDFPSLAPWKRIFVYAAGPAFGLAVFAITEWALPPLTNQFFPTLPHNRWYAVIFEPYRLFEEGNLGLLGTIPGMLVIMSLIWNLFNLLLPIIPLDGGQIMREVLTIILPRYGTWLAYGFSFLLAGGFAVYSLLCWLRPTLPYPPLHPGFAAFMFGMMAYQCFGALQSLRTTEPSPRRHTDYDEKDW